MSKRLLACVRADDVVARMGGDEFTILLDRIAGIDDVCQIAARILEGMPTLVGPPDSYVPVGMSLGVVVAETRHMTPESLLTEADMALYASKKSGKGCASVFAPDKGVVRI
jgi:diguanylate cyclase (GGDEF)-like protein